MDVAEFYDDYTERQAHVGVNDRHRSILRSLQRFGLRADSVVLEIGCGIGTLTELVAPELRTGQLFSTDISPKSIEIAKRRLAKFDNVELFAGDVLEMEPGARFAAHFDVIVLPDVIEHIPVDKHFELFRRVASWLKQDGFVLLHYPNPHHLEWVGVHRPEDLQIIDQPIHADVLTSNVYPHGLSLDYYERYSIWVREGDYVVAVLRPRAGMTAFTDLPQPQPGIVTRAIERARILRRSLAERRRPGVRGRSSS